MTQTGQSERPVTRVAKFSNRSRFSIICSYSRLGAGRFPQLVAGFGTKSGRIWVLASFESDRTFAVEGGLSEQF